MVICDFMAALVSSPGFTGTICEAKGNKSFLIYRQTHYCGGNQNLFSSYFFSFFFNKLWVWPTNISRRVCCDAQSTLPVPSQIFFFLKSALQSFKWNNKKQHLCCSRTALYSHFSCVEQESKSSTLNFIYVSSKTRLSYCNQAVANNHLMTCHSRSVEQLCCICMVVNDVYDK